MKKSLRLGLWSEDWMNSILILHVILGFLGLKNPRFGFGTSGGNRWCRQIIRERDERTDCILHFSDVD